LGALSARIDLRDPASGFQELRVGNRSLPAHLLGVLLKQHVPPTPTESYVRCEDLVATYPPGAGSAIRVQVYWRAHETVQRLAVELQVSVQTDELDIATPVVVASQLETVEVLRLIEPRAGRFAPLSLAAASQRLVPQDGLGCLLFHLPASEWCYAEMIHPADFQQDSISLRTRGGAARQVSLEHRLFPGTLEKGVILRARLRGLFLPKLDATTQAAADYLSFLSSPLPLTT
jgi:hypothetical protein